MRGTEPTVFLIDGNPVVAQEVAGRLGAAGYRVSGSAPTVLEAREFLTEDRPDAILIGVPEGAHAGESADYGPQVFYYCSRVCEGGPGTSEEAEGQVLLEDAQVDLLLASLAGCLGRGNARTQEGSPGLSHEDQPPAADGVLTVDAEGRVTGWNQRLLDLWEVPRALVARQPQALPVWIGARTRDPGWLLTWPREAGGERGPGTWGPVELLDGRVFEWSSVPHSRDGVLVGRVVGFREVGGKTVASMEPVEAGDRFRVLFEMAPDACFMHDLRGRFVDGNRAAEELTGYSRDELIGRNMLATGLLDPRDVPKAVALLGQSLMGRTTGPDLFWLRRKDGRRVQVELRSVPLRIDDQTVVLGIARDMGDRARAEMALRESEARLQEVLEVTGEGIWDWDLAAGVVRHNRQWCRMVGLDERYLEHPASSFLERLHPEDRATVETRLQHCLESAGPYRSEHRMVGADGQTIWVLDRGDVVERDAAGKALRIVGSMSDLTRRRQDEEAVSAARLRLELALEGSRTSIWESDLRTGRVYLSPEWATMLGDGGPELGETVTSIPELLALVPPEDIDRVLSASRGAVQGTVSRYSVEHRVRSRQGDWRWILSHGRVVERDEQGRAVRLAGTNTDITDRKLAEEDLARTAERARQRAEQLVALNEIGRTISALGDLQGRLDAIFQEVRRVLPLDIFFIGLATPGERTISYPIMFDGGKRWDDGTLEPLTEGSSSARILRTGSPFLVNRTPDELAAEPVPLHAVGDKGRTSASLMFAPLIVGDRILGVISAQSYALDAFTEHDLQLLVGISYQAAIAIENARLYSAAQVEIEERQRTAEALRRGNEELRERTAELQSSYSLLQAAFDATADGLLVVDRDGRISGANQRFFQIWQVPGHLAQIKDDVTMLGFLMGKVRDPEGFRRCVEGLYATPERESVDLVHLLDGRLVERFSCPQILQGQIVGRVFSFRDITERTRALQAAEESERRFHDLFEFSSDAIIMANVEGAITLANRQAEKLFGWQRGELLGKAVEVLLPESMRDAHVRLRGQFSEEARPRRMGPGRSNLRACRKDGTEVPVDVTLNPIMAEEGLLIAATVRDISDRVDGERRLLRAQRLESLGRLAGGIAHDLNNTLSPILMSLDLLRVEFPQGARELLDAMETGARRGADMVRQLLTFAKGSEGERRPIQPAHLLRDIEKIVRSTFPKNVRLESRFPQELPVVTGDATQLHQVLLNLCVNARDAMPHGGTLTLSADPFEVDPTFTGFVADATPGSYLLIRVRDTGVGIPAEDLDRIFEPFFTTKGPERGSGLGLATVMGLVKGHGGIIRVESTEGHGALFEVYLPVGSTGVTGTAPVASEVIRGAGELILVVDDEQGIRDMLRRMLEGLNYSVVTADDGAEALARFQDRRNDIRLIITDINMPYLDGVLLVRTLRLMSPAAGIVAMTGLQDEVRLQQLRGLGVTQFLAKPFTRAALVDVLRDTLGVPPG